MKVSSREAVLIFATFGAALFGGTIFLIKPRIGEWKEVREAQAQVRDDIKWAKELVRHCDRWDKAYAEQSQRLSRFPADKKMDIHWRSVMNGLASGSGIRILRMEPSGDESQDGEVRELPMECRDWEGSLDAFTKFLYALETGNDMLDIRQLRIKPKGKTQLLGGRFSLYCAYTREGAAATDESSNENEKR